MEHMDNGYIVFGVVAFCAVVCDDVMNGCDNDGDDVLGDDDSDDDGGDSWLVVAVGVSVEAGRPFFSGM